MKHQAIPICYFPSTIIFISDNTDYLPGFMHSLPSKWVYQAYTDANKALQVIDSQRRYANNFQQRCQIDAPLDTLITPDAALNVDLAPIYSEVYNPCRFQEIAVVVIDLTHSAAVIKQVLGRLQHYPMQKIFLTDVSTHAAAIEAYNEGWVSAMIDKNHPQSQQDLHQQLLQCQRRYFNKMSESIVKTLDIASPTCLSDPEFCTWFRSMCESHAIVEYYLMDLSGSFLLFDQQGNSWCLIVRREVDMNAFVQHGKIFGASESMIDAVKKRQHLPMFQQYRALTVPAEHIDGRERYFYTLVSGKEALNIDSEQVTSYQDFLDSADALAEVVRI